MLPKIQEIMGTNAVNNSQNETESTEVVETRNKKRNCFLSFGGEGVEYQYLIYLYSSRFIKVHLIYFG